MATQRTEGGDQVDESQRAVVDLEKEYGWLLDGIQKYVNQDEEGYFAHFGVRGMKWGVRKDDSTKSKLTGLGPDEITRTTSAGDEITISKNPPGFIVKQIAKRSSKFVEHYNNGAYFIVKDKDGKKVGDAIVNKKNDDELYLNWISIKNSHRGKGYASATLQAAAEYGRQAGFKKMTLEVPANAPDARHIYEKMGFKVTNEVVDPKDVMWGGLTSMEYDFSTVKHREGGNKMGESEQLSVLDTVLSHYGVKGMKWGRRKDRSPVDIQTSAEPGKRVQAKGGENQPASEDARRAAAAKQKAKASTTDALSNKELQELVTRMNLEQQYSRLTSRDSGLKRFNASVKEVLGIGKTYNEVIAFQNSPAGQQIKDALKK